MAAYNAANYSGGDGSSFAQAVKILTETLDEGVAAEYAYLARHFPGCPPNGQMLREEGGIPYDVLKLDLPDGTTKEIYFDISSFHGKQDIEKWLEDFLKD